MPPLVRVAAVGAAEAELRLVGDLRLLPRRALVVADRDIRRPAPDARHVDGALRVGDPVPGAAVAVGWLGSPVTRAGKAGSPDGAKLSARPSVDFEQLVMVELPASAPAADRAVVDEFG